MAGPEHIGPILLKDQFQDEFVNMILMTKFLTPVKKNNFPYCDSTAHYTWWELIEPMDPEPLLFVNAQDQFGFHDLEVLDSRFLLTPALKYPEAGDTIPEKNHYLCYDAVGEPLDIDVMLVDQFDSTFVAILHPVYFCNPCVKELLDSGVIYPIVDPLAHLIIYRIENPMQYNIFATALDQFGFWQMNLWDNLYLVVPALKNRVQYPTE